MEAGRPDMPDGERRGDPVARSSRTRRRAARSSIALAAVMFVACGGGGTVSAESFVHDICAAVNDWVGGIQGESEDLVKATSPGISPQEGKDILLGFWDNMIGRTDELISDVDAAGVPDVDRGEEAVEALKDALNRVKESLARGRDRIEALPTDDEEAFSQQAQEVGTSIQTELSAIGESLDKLQVPGLESLAARDEACQSIGG